MHPMVAYLPVRPLGHRALWSAKAPLARRCLLPSAAAADEVRLTGLGQTFIGS
jgi:hypothetical protein